MKVFVTGVMGQLGHDVINELLKRGHEAIGSDIADAPLENGCIDCGLGSVPYVKLDITDKEEVTHVINKVKPDSIIHCAAWTAVDAAQDEENKEKVFAINAKGTGYIACAARENDCKMMYISTDYVFDGAGSTPWNADCTDYAPINVYGQSKLMGEKEVKDSLEKYFIVRIAWVFGDNGNNFVKTMLKLADKYDGLRVVNDQIGTPTYTYDLARLLVDMIETDKYGCYHATNEGGFISWCDFAKEIFRQAGRTVNVTPVTTAEYGISKAARPFNSRLDKSKLKDMGFEPLPAWQDALARYIEKLTVEK